MLRVRGHLNGTMRRSVTFERIKVKLEPVALGPAELAHDSGTAVSVTCATG